jgi:pSer/pThr/pTyr-binding forkhead associated (FHA) protein
MNPALAVLVLRAIIALALYAFLSVAMIIIWRDLRSATQPLPSIPEAYLQVLDGLAAGQSFPLQMANTLGRAADNTISLVDTTISAHHCRISYQGGQWWLEDLGSRNGTAVNDLLLQEPLVVTYGDRINLGRIPLLLRQGVPVSELGERDPDSAGPAAEAMGESS